MKKIGSFILIFLIILFGYIGIDYIYFRMKNAVSNAAFVKTDSLLTLSFKVGGKVIQMRKNEGDMVKKGEILALIDTTDFLIAKKKIINQIEALKSKKEALKIKKEALKKELDIKEHMINNEKEKISKNIESLKFGIKSEKIQLYKIIRDTKRFENLYQKKLIQKEKFESIKTKKEALEEGIKAKEANLEAIKIELKNINDSLSLIKTKRKNILELEKEIESLQKNIKALENSKEEIQNKIEYAKLISPIDGKIAKKFVNNDRIVKRGSPIYAVVNPKDIHIEVLLSEKKLKGVKEGNEVSIEIDAFKNKKYKGKVEKILPTSAATFSLVPRDIASGEFTKLDQRFIVRISINNPSSNLKIGMGASVAIKRD